MLAIAGGGCEPSIPECQAPAPPPLAEAYLLVEYTAGSGASSAPPPTVDISPDFSAVRPKLRRVTLRPPDACFEDQTSIVPGAVVATALSLRRPCAPWVSELELVLSNGGLVVVPWAELLRRERDKNASTTAAAKDLGADAVFVFYRLSIENVSGSSGNRQRFRYFTSNAQGEALFQQTVDDTTKSDFEAFVGEVVGRAPENEQTGIRAWIAAKAFVPDKTEPIWSYERDVVRSVGAKTGMRFLFGKLGEERWRPVAPAPGYAPTIASEALRAERSLAWMRGLGGAPMQTFDDQRFELLHTGAIDFVRAFHGAP